jgi:HSP20 family molecular chaperone IbpA
MGAMTTGDPRAWMWNEALAMLARAEHMQRRFFEPVASTHAAAWEPPVDIFENDLEFWIVVALPGVEQRDLQVSLEAGGLRVAGQRRLPAVTRAATLRRLEIPHGWFERSIALPRTNLALGRSELVNGCLVICLTKHD